MPQEHGAAGQARLTARWTIGADAHSVVAAQLLANATGGSVVPTSALLRQQHRPFIALLRSGDAATHQLAGNLSLANADSEGYVLDIRAQRVVILGQKDAGIFFGAQTLLQLLGRPPSSSARAPSPDGSARPLASPVPVSTIWDWPSTKFRGMWVQEGQDALEELFAAADRLSWYKLSHCVWAGATPTWLRAVGLYPCAASDAACAEKSRSYRTAMLRARDYFAARHIELVPAIAAGGEYPMAIDPATVEGKWSQGDEFVFGADGIAHPVAAEVPLPRNGNLTAWGADGLPVGWTLKNNSRGGPSVPPASVGWRAEKHGGPDWLGSPSQPAGAMCVSKAAGSPGAGLCTTIAVRPAQVYQVSLFVRVEGLRSGGGGYPGSQVMQLDNNSRHHAGYAQGEGWISETNTQGVNIVDNTTGWHAIEQVSVLTVDSASRLQVCVLVPDSVELGDLCVGGLSIDRLDGSLRNLIRTNITDVRLRPARAPTSRSGHLHTSKLEQYTLGKDFSVDAPPIALPTQGQANFSSLLPAVIRRNPAGAIPVGAKVRLDYDFSCPPTNGKGVNPACFAEPRWKSGVTEMVAAVAKNFPSRYFFFSGFDEIEGVGRDSRTIQSGLRPWQLLGEAANTLQHILRRVSPVDGARAIIWSDEFSIDHNGLLPYYQYWWGGTTHRTEGGGWNVSRAVTERLVDPDVLFGVWWYNWPASDSQPIWDGKEHVGLSKIIPDAAWYWEKHGYQWLAAPGTQAAAIRQFAVSARAQRSGCLGFLDTYWGHVPGGNETYVVGGVAAEVAMWGGVPLTAVCAWNTNCSMCRSSNATG